MTKLRSLIRRLSPWSWDDDWQAVAFLAGSDTAMCPTRNEPVSLDVCRACPQRVECRTVSDDSGGSVAMIICKRDGGVGATAGPN